MYLSILAVGLGVGQGRKATLRQRLFLRVKHLARFRLPLCIIFNNGPGPWVVGANNAWLPDAADQTTQYAQSHTTAGKRGIRIIRKKTQKCDSYY
jgi:hypothetical protein